MSTPGPFPSVFVSHGSPMLIMEQDSAARAFLSDLGNQLGKPKAIVAISAHWMTRIPAVSGAIRPETIHDFSGFPRELYDLRYPAPGAPELARQIRKLSGAVVVDEQGLDHGAWIPLSLMYPSADIPVLQFSVLPGRPASEHITLGRMLASLRAEGVLVFASGGSVHNLRALFRDGSGQTTSWARNFSSWLDERLMAGDNEAIVNWQSHPDALNAHPSDEHFLPLPVAVGAAGEQFVTERLHSGFEHGSIGMHAYAFRTPGEV